MSSDLRDYVGRRGATGLDPDLLRAYTEAMTNEVIPEIVRDSAERERLAAQLRQAPNVMSVNVREA